MKKAMLIASVLLFSGLIAGYSQQTTAPDQAAPQDTNQAVSNTAVQDVSSNENNSDTNAPVVTEEKEITPSGGVTFSDGETTFASGDVQYEIQATDEVSGVKQIDVMLDDSAFSVYEKPIGFESEGQHVIAYKAENNVGNVSPVKYYSITVDKTAPEATLTPADKVVQIGGTDYANSGNKFIITAQDRLSGVKSIEYSLDGGDYQSYADPIAVKDPNGAHKIDYKTTDNVGNVSKVKSYEFYLDSNPPTAQVETTPAPFVKDGINYISGSALIVITASDQETGIAEIKYSIDGGDELNYSFPFKLPAGEHTVKAKAMDLLGNESEEVTIAVTVDVSTPETEIKATK